MAASGIPLRQDWEFDEYGQLMCGGGNEGLTTIEIGYVAVALASTMTSRFSDGVIEGSEAQSQSRNEKIVRDSLVPMSPNWPISLTWPTA